MGVLGEKLGSAAACYLCQGDVYGSSPVRIVAQLCQILNVFVGGSCAQIFFSLEYLFNLCSCGRKEGWN